MFSSVTWGRFHPIHKVAVKMKGWCMKQRFADSFKQMHGEVICPFSSESGQHQCIKSLIHGFLKKLWTELPHVSILASVWINSVYFTWRHVLFQPPGPSFHSIWRQLLALELLAPLLGEKEQLHIEVGTHGCSLTFCLAPPSFTKSRRPLDTSVASLRGNMEKLKGA